MSPETPSQTRSQNNFGRASAIGILLLGIILIFSIFYLRATQPGKARED